MAAHTIYPDADASDGDMLVGERRLKLESVGPIEVHYGRPMSDDEYVARLGDSPVALLGWAMPADVIRRAPKLELISFTGIGVGNFVDLEVAVSQGVTVCNCPGYADNTVAEHAFALMFAAARWLPQFDRSMREGGWSGGHEGVELRGKTLGLVGFGGIGQRAAAIGQALGMTVVAWTRNPDPQRAEQHGIEFLALRELLAKSDVVSVHVALSDQTHGLLGADELAQMKTSALLINTARGETVDEGALVRALEAGQLRGAGLDVYATEPLPSDHRLLGLPNVVLTPHVAYNTPEARAQIYDIAVNNIVQYHRGAPINVVASP